MSPQFVPRLHGRKFAIVHWHAFGKLEQSLNADGRHLPVGLLIPRTMRMRSWMMMK
jgi:hypothetical protein